ncbi:MAG: hypothetical protein OEY43_08860 [Gammaproteobacteria bacterium]|nr:hypothetical protein [Gammaproteobacteria bacterium]
MFYLLVAASSTINAMTIITPANLPSEVQTCINNGSCSIDGISIAEHNNASMFNFYDNVSGMVSKLVHYSLTNDSHQINYDVVSNFSGYIWLQTSDHFDSSATSHDFTLYLDQITPGPEHGRPIIRLWVYI